jgi:hypothetical protein
VVAEEAELAHMITRVDAPIACSLDVGSARSQLSEWHELIQKAVAHIEQVVPTRVELALQPDCDVRAVVGLAQREATCCPFFSFMLEIRSGVLVLVIEVPKEASALLEELVFA